MPKDWYQKPGMITWEEMAKWRRRFYWLLFLVCVGILTGIACRVLQ